MRPVYPIWVNRLPAVFSTFCLWEALAKISCFAFVKVAESVASFMQIAAIQISLSPRLLSSWSCGRAPSVLVLMCRAGVLSCWWWSFLTHFYNLPAAERRRNVVNVFQRGSTFFASCLHLFIAFALGQTSPVNRDKLQTPLAVTFKPFPRNLEE